MSAPYLPGLPLFRAFDSAGDPLAGGLLYHYAAGTSSNLDVYDSDGTTPLTQPVVLDTTGTATIRLGSSAYKFVLKDSGGATQWTIDNYQPLGDSPTFSGTVTAGNFTTAGAVTAATGTFSGAVTTGALTASSLKITGDAYTPTVAIGTVTSSLAINCALGNVFTVTMGGSITAGNFTQTNAVSGQTINVLITQDGSGSRTLGLTNLKFPGGSVPALSTAAGAVDLLVMSYIGSTWYASLSKAYA